MKPNDRSPQVYNNDFVAKWQAIRDMGAVLVRSGMLPDSVNTPEKAAAIILKGNEIGMRPMQSFAHINVIKGRTCLSAEGMMAVVYASFPKAVIDFVQYDDQACTIDATRPGGTKNRFSFSYEDAQKAKITGNENWQKFRRAMLRSRCISEMCRALFPDAIQGCSYTPEEIYNLAPEDFKDKSKNPPNLIKGEIIAATPEHVPVPVIERIAKMVEAFAVFELTSDQLADLINKPLEDANEKDLELFEKIYRDLRDKKIEPIDVPMIKELQKAEEF